MYEALSKDKYGNFAWARFFTPRTTLTSNRSISPRTVDTFPLTEANVQNRTFPFSGMRIYIDRSPATNGLSRPRFMRYILSREGQQDVQISAFFYPLPQSVIDEQLKKVY